MLVAEVPPGVATVTSTVPVPAGSVAVIWEAESTTMPVAALAPNFTVLAPLKLVPVIVMLVPPAVDPEAGLTVLTVGRAS